MKLTAKAVAALQLPAGKTDVIHFDDDIPRFGFRLRLGTGGRINRSWVAQYRHGGATRRLLLGSADVLGAEAARAAAKKALAAVELGEDPQAKRAERRGKDRHILKSGVADFLAVKEQEVRPRTYRELERYLSTGVYFRELHGLPVDQITRRDVATRLVAIAREHGASTAARARAALSAFYVWAMTMGIVESNPVIGTPKAKEAKPRERTLSDTELIAVWRSGGDDDYGKIIKLLILTGCRRQEVGGMRWSEMSDGKWTIPPERCKNDHAHELPLMPMAQVIIDSVPQMVSRDYLFGVSGENGYSRWSAAKKLLDKRSGVVDWTVHDIRRSVATRMADLGVAPHIIEATLNHLSGHKAGVAGIYNRSSYEREVRAALALWADHVRALVEGGERRVVAMRAAQGGVS